MARDTRKESPILAQSGGPPSPRLMAWEITRSCNLACGHCRASALHGPYEGELTTQEAFRLLDQVLEIGRPIVILTGGEPLLRPDSFDIAAYGRKLGLQVVLGTNGVLLTPEVAGKLAEIGIPRLSISLDFPNAEEHDHFRGVPGAFQAALDGIRAAQAAGIGVQINSTITRRNVHHLQALLDLALEVGAIAFHPFMLVPTGRGKEMEADELAPADYERTLHWVYDKQQEVGGRIFFKPTDVPHYMRVVCQREDLVPCPLAPANAPKAHVASLHSPQRIFDRRPLQENSPGRVPSGGYAPVSGLHRRPETGDLRGPSLLGKGAGVRPHPGGMQSLTRGCLAGTGFFFVSHRGQVQGCGYLEAPAGNVREQSLAEIWHHSRLFAELRNLSLLKGKCGACEYKEVCGGCRARAYSATGDYLAEEPYCVYQPRNRT